MTTDRRVGTTGPQDHRTTGLGEDLRHGVRKRVNSSIVYVLSVLCVLWPAFDLPAQDALPPEVAAEAEAGHVSTGQRIAGGLRKLGWPDEAIIVAISTLPIVELRGAIPAGYVLKGHRPDEEQGGDVAQKVRDSVIIYVLAVVGNMLPIPFILLLLGPVSRWCMRFKLGQLFFDWLFARTRRKAAGIEKYETLGLTIFVAIPLPVTGGWTGAAAAFLMGMKFHHAMWSILLGVMIAGVIMTVLALMGWIGALIAGVVLCGLAVSALLGMFRREERKDH